MLVLVLVLLLLLLLLVVVVLFLARERVARPRDQVRCDLAPSHALLIRYPGVGSVDHLPAVHTKGPTLTASVTFHRIAISNTEV